MKNIKLLLNPLLKKVKNRFKNKFLFESPEVNILKIYASKESLPFAICITDPAHPNIIIVSLTVEYCSPISISDFIIGLMHISNIELSESFYISQTGIMYWGSDAYFHYDIDYNLNIADLTPVNKEKL